MGPGADSPIHWAAGSPAAPACALALIMEDILLFYKAPLKDMLFVLEHLADLGRIADLEAFSAHELNPQTARAILAEAARVAETAVAPGNRAGDGEGSVLREGTVRVPEPLRQAFAAWVEGGWIGITLPLEHGGQGLPEALGTPAMEMWNSANMALALNPMLTVGACYAILSHGSDAQIERYARRMISGEWCGTMNLTEPGAGSDLSELKTVAERDGDHYRIRGQKIFITWGDHELSENIVHLVLARLPGAPAGTRGISLFIVPKYLVDDDGSLGARNDVHCVSVEHKMGIHGSPTCVMSYGERDGAIGYLVGEENKGLACMFTMMNEARLKVGLQGLACAEGAYQQAQAYARERVQGRAGGADAAGPIIEHADVQRMLLTQRALTEAMRAVAYVEAVNLDISHQHPDPAQRADAQRRIDLMIPVIKAWMTELGEEVASLGMQVHGGMGYIEETGAAQWLRDVRIAGIYEGTNGIQAQDLVFRKLARDGGAALDALLAAMAETARAAPAALADCAGALESARADLETVARMLLEWTRSDNRRANAGAFDFLMQLGYVCGAWQLLRAMIALHPRDDDFARRKRVTGEFYFTRILPRARQHACAARAPVHAWETALAE